MVSNGRTARSASAILGLAAAAIWCGLLAGCGGAGDGGQDFEQQFRRIAKIPNPETRAKDFVRLAYRQRDGGEVLAAATTLNAAAKSAVLVENPAGRASAISTVFFAYAKFDRLSDAEKLMGDAESAVQAIEAPADKFTALTNLGIAYGVYLKKELTAAEKLTAAAELLQQIELPRERASLQLRLGSCYFRIFLPDEGLQQVQAAVQWARDAEPRARADVLAEAAATATKLENPPEAFQGAALFKEAVAAAAEIDSAESKAYALVNLAETMRQSGDTQGAREFLAQAQDVAHEVSDNSLRKPLMDRIDAARRRL